jgi:hypothetical protein
MDVSENGKVIEDEFEMWDFYIDTDNNQFTLNVSSFVLTDNTMGTKPKCYYLYNWHHIAKSITSKGNGKYEIITDGRMGNFEMRIIATLGNNNRVVDLSAYLPIGEKGKEIKQFQINQKKATIDVAPLHNSAYLVNTK